LKSAVRIERAERRLGERRHQGAEAEALERARHDHRPPIHGGRIAEHPPVAIDHEGHAADHEQPVVDPCRNEAHQDQPTHERDAARDRHVAGGVDRVIEQLLQHRRRQGQRRQQDKTKREEHEGREDEVAVLEQRLVEEVRLRSQDMHDVEIETENRGDGFHPDFGRDEPFQAFAAVEQHLLPDHAEREGC
jgi:hypothetical protein